MSDTSKPIVVEEVFSNPVQRVWSAITSVDEMTVWFFENIPAFSPVVGFETAFNVQSGGRNFRHQWRVTEVIPGRKISYRWAYPDYPGDSVVTFELEEEGEGTRLRFLCSGIESFPQDIPEFSRASCQEGWRYFIGKRLKDYLNRTQS